MQEYILGIPTKPRRMNIVFSGGGMSGMYQLGVIAYLSSTRPHTQINRIYGTSAGSISAVVFAFILDTQIAHSAALIDRNMQYMNNHLQREYHNEHRFIINAWRNILRELLPENIHEICTNKVFITMNVFSGGRFRNKVVSRFASKEHLLDVVHSSMSIPFLTIPGLWKLYRCPFDGRAYVAVDGFFNSYVAYDDHINDQDNETKTLFVNILLHKYPFMKRLHLFETSYESFVVDGIRDAESFFMHYESFDYFSSQTMFIRNKPPKSSLKATTWCRRIWKSLSAAFLLSAALLIFFFILIKKHSNDHCDIVTTAH